MQTWLRDLQSTTRQLRDRSPSSLLLATFLCCLCFVSTSAAQGAPVGAEPRDTSDLGRPTEIMIDLVKQRSLRLTVLSDAKVRLDRQAVVKLHDQTRDVTVWQTTTRESMAVFQSLESGDYDIEVSALGYFPEHKALRVTATLQTIEVEVILQRDPSSVDLNASDDDLPPKVRKDAKRASYDLKSSNFKEAQKRLEKLYPLAPSSAQINFLLGYLYLQLKDMDKSESYLTRSATLDPRREQTLTLLGRVQLQRGHYEDARNTLERAIDANSGYWMAHNLLGDAYLKQKDYEKAREEAQAAIDVGKASASVSYLVLGEALANLGRDKEAVQALSSFLQANPSSPAKSQVETLIADIEKADIQRADNEKHDPSAAMPQQSKHSVDLALVASQPSLPPSAWGPPGIDDVKPSVAAGVACPSDQVIEMSGERMKELVDSISQFAATEDLIHEQLDKTGNPITKETRKFDYTASISENGVGFLNIDEYRNDRYGIADLPDRISTTGFVTLALIFHPNMRENFRMTCEGLGQWHGKATWLVHFQQREDKPSRFADLVVGSDVYPLKLKGRAWITADTFQIVRIESELMNHVEPLPVQHQIAEYGPVHFQKKNIDVWLPQSVDLFFEMNRHRYYRRHSFDHFMLFSVNSEDKPTAPKDNKVENR